MIGYTNSVGNVYSENLKGTTMGKVTKAFKDNFDGTMVKRGIAAIIVGIILDIYVDTDPLDFGNYIEDGSLDAIENINEGLGFPDSVYTQMTSTRAIDGNQTYEKNSISVSWKYHPDNGLEVLYSVE